MNNLFELLNIDELILDPHNPRLPEGLNTDSEIDVINWMLESSTLLDLMGSISQNGFFEGEPIIVQKINKSFIVIEGNRRVAAVKLLMHPEWAKSSQLTVNNLANEALEKANLPLKLRVFLVQEKNKLINNYLGFRHVSGVKPWPVIARARYLNSLFEAHPNKDNPSVYKDLAKEIGSKSSYVKRLLYGYDLYLTIRKNNWFGLEDLDEENFDISLITDAATMHNAISAYMGIDYDDPISPFKNLKKERLKEIVKIVYEKSIPKSGGGKTTRLGENRRLRILNRVLGDERATYAFINEGKDLDTAAELAGVTEDNLREYLSKAKFFILEAQSVIQKVESPNDSDLKEISEIIESCYIIQQTLTRKKMNEKIIV